MPVMDVVGTSKDARRRLRRKLRIWTESNSAVDALNFLYGCSGSAKPPLEGDPVADAHRSVNGHCFVPLLGVVLSVYRLRPELNHGPDGGPEATRGRLRRIFPKQ